MNFNRQLKTLLDEYELGEINFEAYRDRREKIIKRLLVEDAATDEANEPHDRTVRAKDLSKTNSG